MNVKISKSKKYEEVKIARLGISVDWEINRKETRVGETDRRRLSEVRRKEML